LHFVYSPIGDHAIELREGETVIHKGRPHWIVFGWAVLLGLLSARFMLGAGLATSRGEKEICLIIAGLLAVYALGAACVAQLYRWSSRLLLTNRRVVLKTGILPQRSSEFLLPTIESVLVELPLRGRLFNYGTLTVRGFGGSQEFIKRISSPERFRELIHEQQSLGRPLARAWRRVTGR
jgi:hypothetical protein